MAPVRVSISAGSIWKEHVSRWREVRCFST
jgi:hypothetical protein